MTQTNSLLRTFKPLNVRNRFMLKGDTSIGRHGRKYLIPTLNHCCLRDIVELNAIPVKACPINVGIPVFI